MRLRELATETWRALAANKLRSFLTMFGIAWGVMSILLMTAFGEGLQRGQSEVARTLGKDILIVVPGRTSLQAGGLRAGRRITFEPSGLDTVRRDCPAVKLLTPELGRSGVLVRSAHNSGSFRVTGAPPFFAEIRSLAVAGGRLWS